MLGGFWRLYRGVAIVVFTLELALVVWLMLGTTGPEGRLGSLVGGPSSPTPSGKATPVAVAAPSPTRAQGTPTTASTTRLTIEMSEADVNTALAEQSGGAPGVKDVAVRLAEDSVVITARLSDPIPATVQATGTLVASGGRLRLLIDEAYAGPLSLPRQAVDLLESRANAALDEIPGLSSLYVEDVEVLAGKARVTARPAR